VIVSVDLSASRVALEEPSDCARFHLVAAGAPDAARLGDVLLEHAVGRTEGDDAFIAVDAVRRLAAGRVGDAWEADFGAMLEYARTKGWLDPSGTAIQAHVEWTDGERPR
jgi:hypothetical protein